MIRVGTIVNVMKAYQTYQNKLNTYIQKRDSATTNKERQYWQDTINMTEEEINDFMKVIIPDPIPKLDVEA